MKKATLILVMVFWSSISFADYKSPKFHEEDYLKLESLSKIYIGQSKDGYCYVREKFLSSAAMLCVKFHDTDGNRAYLNEALYFYDKEKRYEILGTKDERRFYVFKDAEPIKVSAYHGILDAIFDSMSEAKSYVSKQEKIKTSTEIEEEKEQIKMTSMVDDAKNTCKDLGFEEGTDRFVDCSFKLYTQRVELAAKQNRQIVVQGQSSGSNVMTIYDPVRDSNAALKRGQGLINGTCTLGNLSTC